MISLRIVMATVGVIVLLKGFSQAAPLSKDNTRRARLVGSLLYFRCQRWGMGEEEGEGGRQTPVLEANLKVLDFA